MRALEAQEHTEPFLRTVAQAGQSLLMLDYDGTLAPFRRDRSQAFPYPGTASLLQQIVDDGRTRLVIISGRDISETAPLLGLDPVPEIWGLHGLQRRRADGNMETLPLSEWVLDALSNADRWLQYQQLGHTAEIKAGAIAVHWRGLSENETEEIRARVLLGWKTIADATGLKVMEFDGGVEIHAPEANKGDVVRTLLQEVGPNTPAAYLGDDMTDERAFRALQQRGLTVLVRPRWRRTAAQVWLQPPEDLLRFLAQWIEASHARVTHDEGDAARAVAP